jgi:glucose/arabinose dehydrogenase
MRMPVFSFLAFISISIFICPSCKKEKDVDVTPVYSEPAPAGYQIYSTLKQKFWLDTVASQLDKPWGMAFLPNGDLLFSERSGSLKKRRKADGIIEEINGLPEIAVVGQGGLLDILLHPDFKNNGWLYISYSKSVGSNYTTAVARAKISGNALMDVQEIFEAKPAFNSTIQFGCRMQIKGGYLYISVGDRNLRDQAQWLDRHNGKIIRIYDDGKVPTDNPFVSTPNALPEIWSYGHRNPQGLAIDPVSGELWEHEHGPKGGDELNIIKKGANFGWPEITYGIDYDGSIISEFTAKPGMEQPVTYWVPSIAPCGMSYCKSTKYPQWKNNLFIGGLVSRSLFRIELKGSNYVAQERMLEGIGRVRNVVQSNDGFIYIATEDPGNIFRLVPIND